MVVASGKVVTVFEQRTFVAFLISGTDLRRLRAESSRLYIFTVVRVLRWYILVQRDLSP